MKLVTIVGARPQFIKAAAITRALTGSRSLTEVMIHTGQHFDPDMSTVFFEELAIPEPQYHLDIHSGPHGQMTGRMMEAIERVLCKEQPIGAIVYGDTNSTLAGALAAAKLHVPVFHVEAGLRSFNRRMPEEINRVLADHMSEMLFCPTSTAMANLTAEGITRGIHMVGDVMYDATLHAAAQADHQSDIKTRLGVGSGAYAVATVHRPENTDDPAQLQKVFAYLNAEAMRAPIVVPLHPRTRHALEHSKVSTTGLIVCPPLGYFDMTRLVKGAISVYTDSGGLQKEAYFHRVPCVTLRTETEWVETVDAGWNRLWQGEDYRPRREITEYGNGHAAEAIVAAISGYARAHLTTDQSAVIGGATNA